MRKTLEELARRDSPFGAEEMYLPQELARRVLLALERRNWPQVLERCTQPSKLVR